MASSPSPRPASAARLRSPTAFPASCYFSAVSLRGLLLSSASRVLSVSFRQQRPLASPLAGRSHLLRAARSSGDPTEINVVNGEETEQSLGGSTGRDGKESAKSFSSKELLEKLKRYGAAGVLSYGLLNTVYYVTAFLLVWLLDSLSSCSVVSFTKQNNCKHYVRRVENEHQNDLLFRFYFAPAPGKMGYGAAVQRFVKLMAMVWAGSQVTKILRAGGALALAPFVDRGLRWFTVKFNFKSEGKAFATIVGLCFAIAALLFFGLTILWA